MASIQRIASPLTGAISYRVQVRVKGYPAQSETFPNRKEAKQWADSIESAIREGRHFPHARARRTTFSDLAERYLRDVVGVDPDVPEQREPGEKRDSRLQHIAWFDRHFRGLTLAEITPDRIVEARDALAAEPYYRAKPTNRKGEPVERKAYEHSNATVNRYLATLSHMLTMASKEWRLLERNPAREVSRKKLPRGRVRFLSEEERDALLEACAKSEWPQLHTLVVLAITTGGRRGELINLKWKDVDLHTKRAIAQETKNGERRALSLVGKALEELRALKLQNSSRSEWVFPQPSGHPGPHAHFDGHWRVAVEAAGLKDFRFHDLRHTCASYLASQGASLLEIAEVLGHKTLQMVKRYSHLTQTHTASVVEKMARKHGL